MAVYCEGEGPGGAQPNIGHNTSNQAAILPVHSHTRWVFQQLGWLCHQGRLSFQIQGLAITIQYLTKSFEAGTLSVLTLEALFIVPYRLLLRLKLASRHSWLKMAGEFARCPCLHHRQDANGTSKFSSLSQKRSHSLLDTPTL